MSLYLYFIKDCRVKIWGLTPRERCEKVLIGRAEATEDLSRIHPSDHVLILRADYLFEDRLLKYLATTPDALLLVRQGHQKVPVATHMPGSMAQSAVAIMESGRNPGRISGITIHSLETISVSFHQKLRKFQPPFVLPVTEQNALQIEKKLFNWSYKGVTDLVTKWVWPVPARCVVRQCVRFNIQPNQVTFVSFLLVLLAGWFFAEGRFGYGLLAGWIMTFLDTVDGKLARVTVTSSKFGHYFDHLIDLFHPPIWYILWGMGLERTNLFHLDISLPAIYWVIMIGYIAGRLAEGSFLWFIARFEIFCWRPVDSFFRLITARRNPCMILLTLFYFAGRPDLGLLAVAFWTAVATLFLLARIGQAFYLKSRKGALKSWLQQIDWSSGQQTLAIRWFTRKNSGL